MVTQTKNDFNFFFFESITLEFPIITQCVHFYFLFKIFHFNYKIKKNKKKVQDKLKSTKKKFNSIHNKQ